MECLMRRELSCNAHESATSHKKSFQDAIKKLAEGGAISLRKSQAKYKRKFDKWVKPRSNALLATGSISRLNSRTKMAAESPCGGLYRVFADAEHTVTIIRDEDTIEVIPHDRISIAPAMPEQHTQSNTVLEREDSHGVPRTSVECNGLADEREPCQIRILTRKRRNTGRLDGTRRQLAGISDCTTKSDEPANQSFEFPVERILQYNPSDNHFLIRWYGYDAEDDTWETAIKLSRNMIVRYFGAKKQKILALIKKSWS